MSRSLSRNNNRKTFSGSNNNDSSFNAYRTKKKVIYKYNAATPHISDTASSYCPSLPSLHENESCLNRMAMNFFQDCIQQLPALALGYLLEIIDAILGRPLNQSNPFTISPHPQIEILEPILSHMGFNCMANADSCGQRLFVLQNQSKSMRSIIYVADILKQQRNNQNNNNNKNCSESDFGGSAYSSSYCLSTYSCEKNAAKKPMQDHVSNHEGHNHGDNSTCYSGYSSTGYNESRLTAIRVQLKFNAPIEIKIKEVWRLLRYEDKSQLRGPRDGTYCITQLGERLLVHITWQSTSRDAALSYLFPLDLIRIPNKNHPYFNSNSNYFNKNIK